MEITLDRLGVGEHGIITALGAQGAMRRRFLDFGLIEGTSVECLRVGPSGSPILYRVRGTLLALRRKDAASLCAEMEPS